MREILFRGKRIDNGEWVEGDLIAPYFISPYQNSELYINETYVNGKCVDGIVWGQGTFYRIAPPTVGQYTGMNDKNGKRIFEGDIVYVTGLMPHPTWGYDSVTGVVEWCGGAFEVEGKANDDYVPYGLLYDSCDACREIIGNIHDNP